MASTYKTLNDQATRLAKAFAAGKADSRHYATGLAAFTANAQDFIGRLGYTTPIADIAATVANIANAGATITYGQLEAALTGRTIGRNTANGNIAKMLGLAGLYAEATGGSATANACVITKATGTNGSGYEPFIARLGK